MSKLIALIKEKGEAAVRTRKGRTIKIYTTTAAGDYQIHGVVESGAGGILQKWNANGVSSIGTDYDLEPFSRKKHFDWGQLPSWANLCLFRRDGVWFCGSVAPMWDTTRSCYGGAVTGYYCPLPSSVAEPLDYGFLETDKSSLIINPKYDEMYNTD